MNKLISILLLLSFMIAHEGGEDGHRHDRSHPNLGFIEGIVVNADTAEPIEYASVSIYDLDTKELVAGAITDIEGYFSIDKVPMGSFFVLVQFIAYEVFTVENVILNSISGIRQNLGEIRLIPKSIEGLEVSLSLIHISEPTRPY